MTTDRYSSTNLFSIQGRNALITGGTSGIGFMLAEGLIINGIDTLFITGHESDKTVQEKVSALEAIAHKTSTKCKILG
jgi:NAD(P)-dependent dehydrogenase (short-subunit alcohol dehydrogenase family)